MFTFRVTDKSKAEGEETPEKPNGWYWFDELEKNWRKSEHGPFRTRRLALADYYKTQIEIAKSEVSRLHSLIHGIRDSRITRSYHQKMENLFHDLESTLEEFNATGDKR